jgi:cobalamin biosynthesis Mg chelatase CobN
VSQALGFDPENPLVKMEVSQILSMQDNIPNKDLFLQEMSKQLHYENPRDSSEQQQRNTTSITPAQITMLDRRSDESNKEDEQSSVGTASPAKQKKNKAAETPVNSVSEPTVSDGFTMISVITWSSLIIFAFAAVSISGVIIWKKQRKS